MRQTFRVGCVQNCAGDNLRDNLDEALTLSRAAAADGAELICLPEYFALTATTRFIFSTWH